MSGSVTGALREVDHRFRQRCAGEIIDKLHPLEPVYLYCEAQLRERAGRFMRGFPGLVSYAVKANPESRVLRTLQQCGLKHFDVASLAEIRAVLTHAPAARLHYNNPVKAYEAIEESYRRYGLRSFALDEFSELEKIRRATRGDPDVLYTVRFKLPHDGAAYDFGSKFGATTEQATALLRAIGQTGARAALTFHPGSQCTDPSMYARYIEQAALIIRQVEVKPEFVNVGGGFPEHYLDTGLPPLETYFEVIGAAANRYLRGAVPLMCEPGRGMVAGCVTLLTRIIHVRDCGRHLFLNDGVYGSMQEQSVIELRFPARAWRSGQPLHGPESNYQVFGPTCDPIDRMARPVILPRGLRAGDYVEFGLFGAYGSVTSTSFNGFQPGCYMDVVESTQFSQVIGSSERPYARIGPHPSAPVL